jgi:PAS domain S-box-containing protein
VRDGNGAVIAGIEVVRDITDRKLAEEAARNVKRNLADAQRIAHMGSWELDHQANVLWWSDETYRIFGVNQRDTVSNETLFMEAVHPDDRHSVKNAFTASIVDEIPYSVVYRIIRRSDGELRYLSEQCEHTKDSFGIIVRSQGVVQDITKRKLSEEIRERD